MPNDESIGVGALIPEAESRGCEGAILNVTKPSARKKKKPPADNAKCNVKGCPTPPPGLPRTLCGYVECNMSTNASQGLVHQAYYDYIINKSTSEPMEGKVFCTIGCQKKYVKEFSTLNLTWDNDGANGKSDPLTSQHHLIEWLVVEGNFAKWRCPADSGGGMTKIELVATIGRWISEKGVLVTHTQEQVKAKIEWVTNSMKEAFDWENSVTGAGVRESQGPIRFRATILSKCSFYFYLKEVFVARAGIKPKCNSSEL